ncbi:hypothetical protein [Streptomyces sp. CB01201]|uniref:hypothetical protein n=1 Tax=Streptomyces sp. CB01201 TaxID=2020324 RepID=UPI00131E9AD7|nr:hypothetical protein [Streptomyces sp. CB01201]
MLKLSRGRAAAVSIAALALASGNIISTAGTAQASWIEHCGNDQGGSSGAPWYGWTLNTCILKTDWGTIEARVHGSGGDTDVRVYVGVYNSCNGITYGINGDSESNHFYPFPGNSYFQLSNEVNLSCSSGLWGIARLSESGNGSPWVWSSRL